MEKKNPYKYISVLKFKNPYNIRDLEPFFNNKKTFVEDVLVAQDELIVKLLEDFISKATDEKDILLAKYTLEEKKVTLENAKYIRWNSDQH